MMLLGAGMASAHVTVSPDKTNEGAYAHATFSVPNESDTAKTDRLTVSLPEDTPFTSVSVQPVEGWTAKVQQGKLDQPVDVHGTTVTEAATSITWTADKTHQIGQDEFQTFTVSLGTLPSAGTDVVLPAAQHYTDGSVVKWDDPAGEDGQEPEHPAPSFTTTAAPSDDAHGGPAASSSPAELALALFPEEERDGEAVEGFVARLGHDLVDDFHAWVSRQPLRDLLTELIALLRHRRREDLHAVELAVVAAA
jgi:uncharacterized protein YcnI